MKVGRREDIEARVRRLEAELSTLARYGDDVYEDGDVIKFGKNFAAGSKIVRTALPRNLRTCTYVALKVDGTWYATGNQVDLSGCSWDTLVDFMFQGISVEEVYVATSDRFVTREQFQRQLEDAVADYHPDDIIHPIIESEQLVEAADNIWGRE